MAVTALLLLLGAVSRLGRYLPAQSIAGFLFVIGLLITFIPNAQAVAQNHADSPAGYIALGVTAWSKNPFLGMLAGVIVRYAGAALGI